MHKEPGPDLQYFRLQLVERASKQLQWNPVNTITVGPKNVVVLTGVD